MQPIMTTRKSWWCSCTCQCVHENTRRRCAAHINPAVTNSTLLSKDISWHKIWSPHRWVCIMTTNNPNEILFMYIKMVTVGSHIFPGGKKLTCETKDNNTEPWQSGLIMYSNLMATAKPFWGWLLDHRDRVTVDLSSKQIHICMSFLLLLQIKLYHWVSQIKSGSRKTLWTLNVKWVVSGVFLTQDSNT